MPKRIPLLVFKYSFPPPGYYSQVANCKYSATSFLQCHPFTASFI